MSSCIPIAMQLNLEPVKYRVKVNLPPEYITTNLESLCKLAQIPLQATVPQRTIYVYVGNLQIRTKEFDLVGVPHKKQKHKFVTKNGELTQESALRALEALAHSFFDHSARACVCHKKGLFVGKIQITISHITEDDDEDFEQWIVEDTGNEYDDTAHDDENEAEEDAADRVEFYGSDNCMIVRE